MIIVFLVLIVLIIINVIVDTKIDSVYEKFRKNNSKRIENFVYSGYSRGEWSKDGENSYANLDYVLGPSNGKSNTWFTVHIKKSPDFQDISSEIFEWEKDGEFQSSLTYAWDSDYLLVPKGLEVELYDENENLLHTIKPLEEYYIKNN